MLRTLWKVERNFPKKGKGEKVQLKNFKYNNRNSVTPQFEYHRKTKLMANSLFPPKQTALVKN